MRLKKLKIVLIGVSLFVGFMTAQHFLLQLNYICYSIQPRLLENFNDSFVLNFMQNASTSENHQDELSADDFGKLIDLEDFKFTMNHDSCSGLDFQPLVVILIHSKPDHFRKRKVIRETWGEKDPRGLLLFVVGSVKSSKLQDDLDVENVEHNDLVQGNFHDSYRNLTYKHVMALKWFVYNCPNVTYLLKTDDDVFVNTPLLYNYLEMATYSPNIVCSKLENPDVHRIASDKWYVTYDEYSGSHYPNYCMGYCILYPTELVSKIYREAQNSPYFWIDDVYITGIITSKLGISISTTGYLKLSEYEQKNLLNGCIEPRSVPFIFALHDISEKNIKKLWMLVNNSD